MKTKILGAALIASAALAAGALAPSAASASLAAGNYEVDGIQQICLVSDGTWYGETFHAWGGHWLAGPTRDDGTLIFGNYNSGAGNDSMVVEGTRSVDWTEWSDDGTFGTFIDGTFAKIRGPCTPPAAGINRTRNPQD